jgi:hypothetical protein
VSLVILGLLVVQPGVLPADAPVPVAVVSPPAHAFLASGNVYAICKGPAGGLAVDGVARPRGARSPSRCTRPGCG